MNDVIITPGGTHLRTLKWKLFEARGDYLRLYREHRDAMQELAAARAVLREIGKYPMPFSVASLELEYKQVVRALRRLRGLKGRDCL